MALHSPAHLHTEETGLVLIQRQAGGLVVDAGLEMPVLNEL
jgi:hypothetical protein